MPPVAATRRRVFELEAFSCEPVARTGFRLENP